VKHDQPFAREKRILAFFVVLLLASAAPVLAQDTTPTPLLPGWVPSNPSGFIDEPQLLRKLIVASEGVANVDREPSDGVYAELGHMVTGAGWISGGPGYRRHLLDGRALVEASGAVSWNFYKTAQSRFELRHLAHDRLTLGAQVMYQDLVQVEYFGVGNASLESKRTAYRLNNTDVLSYGSVRATPWLTFSGRVGWIPQPNLSTPAGRNVTAPSTIDAFAEDGAPGVRSQPPFLHADASIVADRRDHAGHPTGGGLYRATAATFSDRDAGRYSFRRYEVEAAQFIPVFTRRWILALHGWEVFSNTSTGEVVPFYLMPSLGGQNTLRGYADYRFHDADMQAFNVESRWSLFDHVDAAIFFDAGKVAPRPGGLDFSDLKRSYGVGFRVHSATATYARLDIGHSPEGWRAIFKVTDPFRRTTPAFGRSSVVPFVP
jgi:hypothetical protein